MSTAGPLGVQRQCGDELLAWSEFDDTSVMMGVLAHC